MWNVVLQLTVTLVSGTLMQTSPIGSTKSENKLKGEKQYASGTTQIIQLRVPGATSYEITFTDVNTEKDFDVIKVYDGDNTLIQTISGDHSEVVVIVQSSEAEIRFTSDDSMGGTGFLVSWRATVPGGSSTGSSGHKGLANMKNQIADLKSRVMALAKTKGNQVFFDHGLVSDFSAKAFTTLQIERQYHTNNAWINLQREFICKDSGFYMFTLSGSSGGTAPTVVRLEHFSMKRQDAINNGRWLAATTAVQPEPFGPFGTGCILEVQEDDKIRVQFNGTLVDDPTSRIFHLVASKFA